MDSNTALALTRFGLGRRSDEPLPEDPTAWLLGQLQQPDPTLIDPKPSAVNGLQALREDREARKAALQANPGDSNPTGPRRSAALFRQECEAELAIALTTTTPFRERLVWFWTNHFTVSRRRGVVAPLGGSFIEEAIRPNVTGNFADLVLAVMRHPAMLLYLDNASSIGPDSPAGLRRHAGLNENLARECMELHTVSPASGYTQADVTSFARVLTGWSVDMSGDTPAGFVYRPLAHEPGEQTVMNHQFAPTEDGGIAALRFLANHPSTHAFLATKLVRHFVADAPPRDAVRQIEGVLRDTRGDLGQASAALVALPAAWQPGTKFRTPQDYVVASGRLLGMTAEDMPNLAGSMAALGQPPWAAPAPNGWPDQAVDWLSPEAMMRRIDWANGFAGRVGTREPLELAHGNLGPLLREATADAMRHAGSRQEALTLLLTSPEFQRR